MNEHELQQYEAELRRTPPARLPEDFMARMRASNPGAAPEPRTPFRTAAGLPGWRSVWRWLAPALTVALVGLLLLRANLAPPSRVIKQPLASAAGPKGNNVQMDEELVSSFEVVAKLPGGQPVRFQCRQWQDHLAVTDHRRGVEIEENSPRVEVVPVRFETY